MDRLCIKPGVSWADVEGEVALFFHFGSRVLLKGPYVRSLLRELLSALQTPRTQAELYSILSSSPKPDVDQALRDLGASGFIELVREQDTPSTPTPGDLPYLRFLGRFSSSEQSAQAHLARLRTLSVTLLNTGILLPDYLEALSRLQLKKIRVVDENLVDHRDIENYPHLFQEKNIGSPRADHLARQKHFQEVSFTRELPVDLSNDLIVVTGNWFGLAKARELNRTLRSQSLRWLCVIEDYFGGYVGPYFGIPDGPCLECLLERHTAQLAPEKQQSLNVHFPLFSALLAQSAATEILKLAVHPVESKVEYGLFEFDFLNHRSEFHPLLPMPACSVCGPVFDMPIFETEHPQ